MALAVQQIEDTEIELTFDTPVSGDDSTTQIADEAEPVTSAAASMADLVLTTDALDELDAEAGDAPAADEEQPVQQAIELPELGDLSASDEASADEEMNLPPLADDAASADEFVFDSNLQDIFDLYDNFASEEGVIEPLPQDGSVFIDAIIEGADGSDLADAMPIVDDICFLPPQEDNAFLQVITQGPDGEWYTDSSLTTPFDDEDVLAPIVICPVVDWDGSDYLPEPGSDVMLG